MSPLEGSVSQEQFECSQFNGSFMCAFQKEGPRDPCDRCPNNPVNLRRRIERLEAALSTRHNS